MNAKDVAEVFTETVARSAIQRIEIKTAYGPPMVIEKPFEPGPPNPYLQALKPEITITFANGKQTKMMPYGNPGPSKWPQIQAYTKWTTIALGAVAGTWLLTKLYPKKR